MYLAHSFMSDEKKRNSQQPLVLVVEADEDSLLLMNYALDLIGCKFICQNNSSNTVLMAREYQPDLILLDIFLPGMSGVEVVRSLKQEPRTGSIPVVAVTTFDMDERELILDAGFDDYITKPYLIEDLEAVIRRILKRKFQFYKAFNLCQDS
ncbi:response regulator [Richelia sinica]|nr:response regulator [Richelia sinica]MBD2663007.1 response regulator [Richelia sinica FACHB-800]